MAKEEQIEEILDEFDFYKVQRVMNTLNWKWYNKGNVYEIPSVGQMRKHARKLLEECFNGNSYAASGGFWASREDGGLSLKFVVEDMWVEEE
jgi:hypothetical protein